MEILKVSPREVPELPEFLLLLFKTVHWSLLIPVTADTHYPEDHTEIKTPSKRPRHKALSDAAELGFKAVLSLDA